uniref:hypothetical protein n=1 Tax=Microbispora sitophila TaxID=2771537 RepID=UPI001D023A12|nr:hypothetical protein [Microbispora sitophila]
MLEDSIPKTSGKWAVAPMPSWEAGGPGAVLGGRRDRHRQRRRLALRRAEGVRAPKEAVEFATWPATDPGAFDDLVVDGGLCHLGGRAFENIAFRVAQRILSMAAAIWHNDIGAPVTRSLPAYDR